MAQDLKTYFQTLQQRDFLRSMQFRVNTLTYRGVSLLTEQDMVYIKTGSLPGRSVAPISVPYMGLNFKVPGTAQYGDSYQVTFYCDNGLTIKNLFEGLQMAVFDDRKSFGNYNTQGGDRIAFSTFNQNGVENITSGYELVGIFPTQIGDIAMDTTANGGTVDLPITFAYSYWRKYVYNPEDQGTPLGSGVSPIGED